MFHIEDVLQLKDGEQLRGLSRRHVWTLVPPLVLALVLIVLPFFLLFPLFSWGVLGMVLFSFSVLCGIGFAIRSVLLWDADVLLVTTHRLIDVDQRGFFSRTVSEAPLEAIQEMSWSRHGFWDAVLRMGSIEVQTSGAHTTIEARRISQPQTVYELIQEVKDQRIHTTAEPRSAEHQQELTRMVQLLEGLSVDEIKGLSRLLASADRKKAMSDFFIADEPSHS